MIDWKLAARVAGSLSGERTETTYAGKDLGPVARDAERRIVDYTGLAPLRALPEPELVSRRGWIDANIASLRPIFAAVEQKLPDTAFDSGPLGRAARSASDTILGVQLGGLIGYLSQRVLGQYDLPLLDPAGAPRLLLVVPNLLATAERLDADRDELLRWVTLHEVTHAVQFGAVPWLRPLLASTLKEILDALELRLHAPPPLRIPSPSDLQALLASARKGELVIFALGAQRRDLVERLQSTMAVVEGHAEHVMDVVGEQVIPTLPKLRAGLEERRATRSTPLRLLERLIGIEMKLSQYRDGKRFCDTVARRGGIATLDRVWSAQSALPSRQELTDPDRWLARMAEAYPAVS